jgi:hypothetical protein
VLTLNSSEEIVANHARNGNFEPFLEKDFDGYFFGNPKKENTFAVPIIILRNKECK